MSQKLVNLGMSRGVKIYAHVVWKLSWFLHNFLVNDWNAKQYIFVIFTRGQYRFSSVRRVEKQNGEILYETTVSNSHKSLLYCVNFSLFNPRVLCPESPRIIERRENSCLWNPRNHFVYVSGCVCLCEVCNFFWFSQFFLAKLMINEKMWTISVKIFKFGKYVIA